MSALMPRLPLTISFIVLRWTLSLSASICWVRPNSTRMSSLINSPGCIGLFPGSILNLLLSMTVLKKDALGLIFQPFKRDVPLFVDPNRISRGSVPLKRMESVRRREIKILYSCSRLKLLQLPSSPVINWPLQSPHLFSVENAPGCAIFERTNHSLHSSRVTL